MYGSGAVGSPSSGSDIRSGEEVAERTTRRDAALQWPREASLRKIAASPAESRRPMHFRSGIALIVATMSAATRTGLDSLRPASSPGAALVAAGDTVAI